MKLYTKITPTNLGLFSTKVGFQIDYRLALSAEETTLLSQYQYADFSIAHWGEENQSFLSVHQAVVGRKGHCFGGLGPTTSFEASLIEGCQRLAAVFEELRRISAGGEKIFEITTAGITELQPMPTQQTLADAKAPPPLLPPIISQGQPGAK